jgi:hypothetical protein
MGEFILLGWDALAMRVGSKSRNSVFRYVASPPGQQWSGIHLIEPELEGNGIRKFDRASHAAGGALHRTEIVFARKAAIWGLKKIEWSPTVLSGGQAVRDPTRSRELTACFIRANA